MNPVKIEITDEEFIQYFDLATWENDLKIGYELFLDRLNKLNCMWHYYLGDMSN